MISICVKKQVTGHLCLDVFLPGYRSDMGDWISELQHGKTIIFSHPLIAMLLLTGGSFIFLAFLRSVSFFGLLFFFLEQPAALSCHRGARGPHVHRACHRDGLRSPGWPRWPAELRRRETNHCERMESTNYSIELLSSVDLTAIAVKPPFFFYFLSWLSSEKFRSPKKGCPA